MLARTDGSPSGDSKIDCFDQLGLLATGRGTSELLAFRGDPGGGDGGGGDGREGEDGGGVGGVGGGDGGDGGDVEVVDGGDGGMDGGGVPRGGCWRVSVRFARGVTGELSATGGEITPRFGARSSSLLSAGGAAAFGGVEMEVVAEWAEERVEVVGEVVAPAGDGVVRTSRLHQCIMLLARKSRAFFMSAACASRRSSLRCCLFVPADAGGPASAWARGCTSAFSTLSVLVIQVTPWSLNAKTPAVFAISCARRMSR